MEREPNSDVNRSMKSNGFGDSWKGNREKEREKERDVTGGFDDREKSLIIKRGY